MKILLTVAMMLAAWVLAPMAVAEAERALSVKAVMVKQHRTSSPPFARIKQAMDSDSPDWENVQKATDQFMNLCTALEKTEPRKGTLESWKTLVGQYFADAKAMDDAAEARDRPAVQAAHKRLSASCKTCHDAHRVRNMD